MRILVACPLPDFALEELRALGAEVAYGPNLRAEELPDRVADVAILIVDSTRVSPQVITRGRVLQVIVRAGAGVTNIAVDEASTQGVFVAHCPDKDATAVAELAFGLMLALDRHLVEAALAMRQGHHKEWHIDGARGLAGRTLGLVGFGAVGQQIARRAQAFEMSVLAWSPTLTPQAARGAKVQLCNWPRELARKSDIVVAHGPPEAQDQLLVDAEFLENMRSGSYLIHIGHPGVADWTALAKAVERHQLRVACDLFAAEPASEAAGGRVPLLQRPGVVCTHRLGYATEQARDAIAAEVVRIVNSFLISGDVPNCVNVAERSPATWQLVIRVRDQVGVMAAILDTIRSDGINAEEITSRVFSGARAGCCMISLDERPSTEALDAIRALDDVLHLELRAMV
jgi:D-3-phosphoglycerate dehydrogenase